MAARKSLLISPDVKCIGCKLCVTACPFDVPRYDTENKIAKCHLCSDRLAAGLRQGLRPRCDTLRGEGCPAGFCPAGRLQQGIWGKRPEGPRGIVCLSGCA